MAQTQESSVQFSLNHLMHLEQQRIREEDEVKRRALEATQRARLDAERKARAEQEERILAEEARRRAEETAQREESARNEARSLAGVVRTPRSGGCSGRWPSAGLKAQRAVEATNQVKLDARGRLNGVQKTVSEKKTVSAGCVCEHPGDPMCGCLNH